VINLDAALGQQLLPVAVRQPAAQTPAHRHRDHLTGEPVAGRSRRARPRIEHPISLPTRGPAQPTQQTPRGSLRGKSAALEEALTGHFGEHHALICAMMLSTIDALSSQIEQLSARIETLIARSLIGSRS
jgi:hypothetical protein